MSILPSAPESRNYSPFVFKYVMKDSDITNLIHDISGDSAFTNTWHWFSDPSQALLYLRFFPINLYHLFPNISSSPSPIKIGKVQLSTAKGYLVYTNPNVIDFGSVTILRHFNDFRDFEPYTKASIYIPFFGWHDIPIAELYRDDVSLNIWLDITTGYANAYLKGKTQSSIDYIIGEYGQKIGIDIPISMSNQSSESIQLLQNIISGAVSTGSALVGGFSVGGVAGGLAGATLSGISSAQKTINDYNVVYSKQGSLGSFASLFDPMSAYIMLSRVPDDPQLSASVVGRPLNQIKTLSTLSGFTQVSNVNLSLNGQMTQTEANEIESLLKQGVML